MNTLKCLVCSKNYLSKKPTGKYCSFSCYTQMRRRTHKEVPCSWCGKIKTVSVSRKRNFKSYYCNIECKGKGQLVLKQNKYSYRRALKQFWDKVDKTPGQGPKGECWTWTGQLCNGYGEYSNNLFITTRVHRIAYFLSNDLEEQHPKVKVCHRCDLYNCCNPSHLFLGTQKDNVRDMWDKGRQGGCKTLKRRKKLPPEGALLLRTIYRTGLYPSILSMSLALRIEYPILYNLLKGKTYT